MNEITGDPISACLFLLDSRSPLAGLPSRGVTISAGEPYSTGNEEDGEDSSVQRGHQIDIEKGDQRADGEEEAEGIHTDGPASGVSRALAQ